MTVFQHRLILVVPAAKVAAVATWFAGNIGVSAVPSDLGPGLNPSGLIADAATYRWCSGAWLDSEMRQIGAKLCQLAGVVPPTLATWNGWTGAQKRSWAQSVQASIFSGYGAWIDLSDNASDWGLPGGVLAALGLKTISGFA